MVGKKSHHTKQREYIDYQGSNLTLQDKRKHEKPKDSYHLITEYMFEAANKISYYLSLRIYINNRKLFAY